MRFIVAVFLCFFLMLQPYAALGRLNREPDPSCSNTIEPAGKNLYVLSIGVDKYDTPQIKLQLANADARAFLEAITEHGRGLYRNIYSKLLTDPGVSDIESALESVIRTANPQDTFVLYYAGSGSEIVLSDGEPSSSDDSEAKRNRGIRHQPTEQEINSLDTILPTRTISNLNDKQNVLTNSITGRQLAAYCSRILANRQILILDSCYSSASIPNVQKLLLTKPDLDGVGRSIAVIGLSSSEDEDLALGHGQLTKAVLLGLSGQADSANTGEISISTLQAFVKKTAPTLGNANLTPITIATFLHGNDFIFAEH
ncbi:MAG: caspase family protein, partial [Cyanobacteria bacterium SZAS LIN-5]|nr:caspase family protein [Cyanobacteria bacterium SZAS LIN-5]